MVIFCALIFVLTIFFMFPFLQLAFSQYFVIGFRFCTVVLQFFSEIQVSKIYLLAITQRVQQSNNITTHHGWTVVTHAHFFIFILSHSILYQ